MFLKLSKLFEPVSYICLPPYEITLFGTAFSCCELHFDYDCLIWYSSTASKALPKRFQTSVMLVFRFLAAF
jgi:hypothetical protein